MPTSLWIAPEASEAAAIRLVDRAVPAEQLDETVDELAGRLSRAATLAIAMIKDAVNRGQELPLSEALEIEARNFARAGVVLQPTQLIASAGARLCDRADGPKAIGYGCALEHKVLALVRRALGSSRGVGVGEIARNHLDAPSLCRQSGSVNVES